MDTAVSAAGFPSLTPSPSISRFAPFHTAKPQVIIELERCNRRSVQKECQLATKEIMHVCRCIYTAHHAHMQVYVHGPSCTRTVCT